MLRRATFNELSDYCYRLIDGGVYTLDPWQIERDLGHLMRGEQEEEGLFLVPDLDVVTSIFHSCYRSYMKANGKSLRLTATAIRADMAVWQGGGRHNQSYSHNHSHGHGGGGAMKKKPPPTIAELARRRGVGPMKMAKAFLRLLEKPQEAAPLDAGQNEEEAAVDDNAAAVTTTGPAVPRHASAFASTSSPPDGVRSTSPCGASYAAAKPILKVRFLARVRVRVCFHRARVRVRVPSA
jgi:hypothetical protein